MMEWIITVLKSGAAFGVADQKHPAPRTLSLISIAQPSIIIDDGNGRDLSKEASKPLDILDVSNLSFANMPADNLDNVTQNDNLAYIVVTSGSTSEESLRSFRFRGTNNSNIMSGKPKGVEIEHHNLSILSLIPTHLDMSPLRLDNGSFNSLHFRLMPQS
jgi:non-ribosomal peptide synthetase component F